MLNRKIVRVTTTEFETADGIIHPMLFNLDEAPTVEEFQEIYDDWFNAQEEVVTKSSGNVFADLGLSNPEDRLAKAKLICEDSARTHISIFLDEVYSLAKDQPDVAGGKIFDFLDRLLCAGFFTVCDEILDKVEVDKLPTALMRSFLTITAPAKLKLSARAALYKRIERKMVELKGLEKTRRIIGNLA
jgi:hypothetical protein